ncbi:MAG: hypothetical protein ACLFPQ_03310 [Candidatus Woesearchaeota archaeon]
MFRKKIYGQSRVDSCPFCGAQSTTKNKQGLAVCLKHKDAVLNDMKCACGKWLELRTGKWGSYFNCLKCGNINMRKVFEFNEIKDVSHGNTDKSDNSVKPNNPKKEVKKEKNIDMSDEFILGEEFIRSDDPRYFD